MLIKQALRSLQRNRLTTVVAVLCLGVGIGANVSLFAVIDALLFRPPAGVSDPEQLARVRPGSGMPALARGSGGAASYPQFRDLQQQSAVWVDLAAYAG